MIQSTVSRGAVKLEPVRPPVIYVKSTGYTQSGKVMLMMMANELPGAPRALWLICARGQNNF